LQESLLGMTIQNSVVIDQNAQGYGWYTDVSPVSDGAFNQVIAGNEWQAPATSPAFGHVDLLTVVTHELGHLLGFDSIDSAVLAHDWMTATLATGVRRYPDVVAIRAKPDPLPGPETVVLDHVFAAPAPWAMSLDPSALGVKAGNAAPFLDLVFASQVPIFDYTRNRPLGTAKFDSLDNSDLCYSVAGYPVAEVVVEDLLAAGKSYVLFPGKKWLDL
jgi:hypothetical protein